MSNSFFSSKYTDPRIENIRSSVRDMQENIPFLLLPVRIETHFVAVERPDITSSDSVLNLYQRLDYLAHLMLLSRENFQHEALVRNTLNVARNQTKTYDGIFESQRNILKRKLALVTAYWKQTPASIFGNLENRLISFEQEIDRIPSLEPIESETIEPIILELNRLVDISKSGLQPKFSTEKLKSIFEEVSSSVFLNEYIQSLEVDEKLSLNQHRKIKEQVGRLFVEVRNIYKVYQSEFVDQDSLNQDLWPAIHDLARPLLGQRFPALLNTLNWVKQKIYDRKYALMSESASEESTQTVSAYDLMIRIYPDDIFIHTHQEALTERELGLGKDYWKEVWYASGDESLELAAWKGLCAEVDPPRAAWITKVLDPSQVKENNKPVYLAGEAIRQLTAIKQIIPKSGNSLPTIINSYRSSGVSSGLKALLSIVDSSKGEKGIVSQYFKIQQLVAPLDRRIRALLHELETGARQGVKKTIIDSLVNQMEEDLVQLKLFLDGLEAFTWLSEEEFKRQNPLHLVFPDVSTTSEELALSPQAKVLPDRFVVIGIQEKQNIFIKAGASIAHPLQVGVDPSQLEEVFPDGKETDGHWKNSNISWMFEYPEAVEKGMAITVPLKKEEVEGKNFEKILVLGIRETSAQEGQELLEELFNNHHYSGDGMSLLPIGAATNNTEEGGAAFSESQADLEKSFRLEQKESPLKAAMSRRFDDYFEYEQFEKLDGQRLVEALGINPEVFERIEGTAGKEISNAFAANQALWYGTGGYLTSEMLHLLLNIDNVMRIREFFLGYCSPRGVLSSLRIGDQPYGILPTTAFSLLEYTKDNELPEIKDSTGLLEAVVGYELLNPTLQKRFDIRFGQIIWEIQKIFTEQRLKHAEKNKRTAQQEFMHLLGLQANSVEYYTRWKVMDFFSREQLKRSIIKERHQIYYSDKEFSPHQFAKRFKRFAEKGIYSQGQTKFLLLANKPISELVKFTSSYKAILVESLNQEESPSTKIEELLPKEIDIDFLLNVYLKKDSSLKELHDPFYKTTPRPEKSSPMNTLLFPLLGQSILLSFYETTLEILEQTYYRNESSNKYERGIINRGFRELIRGIRPWGDIKLSNNNSWQPRRMLFENIDQLHGAVNIGWGRLSVTDNPFYKAHLSDTTMADFLRANRRNKDLVKEKPCLESIDKTFTAISQLTSTSPDEMKRLMAGHLDSFSHRLDVWTLGLANKRLSKTRAKNAQGIFLGAYGWVENLELGGKRTKATEAGISIPESLRTSEDGPIYLDKDNEGFIHTPSINHAIAAAVLRSGYLSNTSKGHKQNPFSVNLSSSRVRKALQLVEGVQNGADLGAILGYQFERGLHERYPSLELDRLIYPFRKKYPLILSVEEEDKSDSPVMNVVNGQALIDAARPHFFDNRLRDWTQVQLNEFNVEAEEAEINAINTEIQYLLNHIDALGDLILSENVYHLVQGNHVRAASYLEALAKGGRIPEIQITETPRVGTVVNHRVVLNFETKDANKAVRWDIPKTERYRAEFVLNHWFCELLGPPENYCCLISYRDNNNDEQQITTRLSELPFHPIDLYYMSLAEENSTLPTLVKAIEYYIRKERPKITDDTKLEVDIKQRRSDWGPDIKTIYELGLLLKNTKQVVANARPANGDDFLYSDSLSAQISNVEAFNESKPFSLEFSPPTLVASTFQEGRFLHVLAYGHDRSVWTYELDRAKNTGYWLKLNGDFNTNYQISAVAANDELEIFALSNSGRIRLNRWFKRSRMWFRWLRFTPPDIEVATGACTTIYNSYESNQTHLLFRDSNGAIWHRERIRWSQWKPWDNLNGNSPDDARIAAIESSANRLDIFIRGRENTLLQKTRKGEEWESNWQDLNFKLSGDPVAVSAGDGSLDVLFPNEERVLQHVSWNQNGQLEKQIEIKGFRLPDGHHFSAAALKEDEANEPTIYVFARNDKKELLYTQFDNNSWGEWKNLGGYLCSDPSTIAQHHSKDRETNSTARIDIAAWNEVGKIIHIFLENKQWSGWQELIGENEGNQDFRELENRMENAAVNFERLKNETEQLLFNQIELSPNTKLDQIEDRLPELSPSIINDLRSTLEKAFAFGLKNTIPTSAMQFYENRSEEEETTFRNASIDLSKQLLQAYQGTKVRLKALNQLQKEYDALVEVSEKVAKLQEIAEAVFGKGFKAIPHYRPFNQKEIQQNLQRPLLRYHTRKDSSVVMEEWLDNVAEVRPVMYAYDQLNSLLSMSSIASSALELHPSQFPHRSAGENIDGEPIAQEDYWLGMEYAPDYEPTEDKLSIILANWKEIRSDLDINKAGLVLDQWTEIIPQKEKTTGAAFHFETPDAAPPQNLLLAVSPWEDGRWEWDDLIQTLLDTLSVAKNRAVEPEMLEDSILAQVLPGVNF